MFTNANCEGDTFGESKVINESFIMALEVSWYIIKFDYALPGEDCSILLDPPNGERVVLGEWHRGIVGLVVCTGHIEVGGKI